MHSQACVLPPGFLGLRQAEYGPAPSGRPKLPFEGVLSPE